LKTIILLISLLGTIQVLAQDCALCPLPDYNPVLHAPEWPIEYIKVEKIQYERNPKASFCKRPTEIIDTIVLHHSETPSTDTPERINDFHLSRGTSKDPWYMIAYSYVLNAPYPGASLPLSRASEGRPLDIVGAHAGSDVYVPMNALQKKMMDEGKVVCGKEGGPFAPDPEMVRKGKVKANITTIGLVVIGNYSPFSSSNPNGYSKKNPRFPTKDTQKMIAQMACQLQKKYPNMKTIKWHNYYHPTSCPGSIKDYVGQIKALARNLGCDFN
jgi:hypothetical protein